MTKSLETLIDGQGDDSNLPNDLARVYCAFPDHLHQGLPTTTHQHVRHVGVTLFSWVFPLCTGGIHVSKLLFVFLPLICLLSWGWEWGLCQVPRRREEKLFFLPHIFITQTNESRTLGFWKVRE